MNHHLHTQPTADAGAELQREYLAADTPQRARQRPAAAHRVSGPEEPNRRCARQPGQHDPVWPQTLEPISTDVFLDGLARTPNAQPAPGQAATASRPSVSSGLTRRAPVWTALIAVIIGLGVLGARAQATALSARQPTGALFASPQDPIPI